jgi:hypothetical protein
MLVGVKWRFIRLWRIPLTGQCGMNSNLLVLDFIGEYHETMCYPSVCNFLYGKFMFQ